MSQLEDKSVEFKSWLMQQTLSEQTRRTYLYRVKYFLQFLNTQPYKDDGHPLNVLIEYYREYLQTQPFAKATTINNTIAALAQFCRFVDDDVPKIDRLPLDAKPVRAMSQEEQDRFLQAVALCESKRDKAIALILRNTGVLIGECAALDWIDVQLGTSPARLIVSSRRAGHSADARILPLDETTEFAMRDWLAIKTTRFPSQPALFLNRHGQRMSVSGIDFVIRKLGLEAGLVVSALALRQTWLVNATRNGCDLAEVARLAGHKKLFTTKRYVVGAPAPIS